MRRRPWRFRLGLLALAACRPSAAPSAESILAAALPGLLDPALTPACGPAPARPTRLLLVTAKQCLSCRSMGLVMRRLAATGPGDLVVLVPAPDAEAVCAFARQERVEAPVLAVPGRDFPAAALGDRFLYGVIDARSTVLGARLAMEAQDFFADALGDHPATGRSPH